MPVNNGYKKWYRSVVLKKQELPPVGQREVHTMEGEAILGYQYTVNPRYGTTITFSSATYYNTSTTI